MDLEQKAVELIGQLQALGPSLTDVALGTARIGAIRSLIIGTVCLAVALYLATTVFKRVRRWSTDTEGMDWSDKFDRGMAGNFLTAGVIIGAVVLGVSAVALLTNLYAWVGIWHPEIYLASKVLG